MESEIISSSIGKGASPGASLELTALAAVHSTAPNNENRAHTKNNFFINILVIIIPEPRPQPGLRS